MGTTVKQEGYKTNKTMIGSRLIAIVVAVVLATTASAFQIPMASRVLCRKEVFILMSKNDDGVVELVDDEPAATTTTITEESKPEEAVAPFLSQGEISEESMDLSDPKQARVAIYIILSLLPVLFLIPLMLGSREMIPAEMLPPVDIGGGM